MFILQMLSEPDGRISSNRVCVVTMVAVLLLSILYIVFTKQILPEIPPGFGGLFEWLISAFLFGNVAKNWIAGRSDS